MRDTLRMHVLHCVHHLADKEETDVLTHGTEHLAHIEEQATLDVLHLHEDEVYDLSAGRLFNYAAVAVGLKRDYILLV